MLLPPGRACIEACELSPEPGLLARFEALRGRPYPWLLDSSLPSPRLGRWSFAGAEPYAVLRVRGERCELECRRGVRRGLEVGRRSLRADPLELLRALAPPLPEGVARRRAALRRRRAGLFRLRAGRVLRGARAARRGRSRPARRHAAARRPRARARPRERQRRSRSASASATTSRARGRTPRRPRASSRARAKCRSRRASGHRKRSAQRAEGERSEADLRSTGGARSSARPVPVRLTRPATRRRSSGRARRSRRATSTRPASRTASSATSAGDAFALHLALRRRNPAPFACFFELPEAAIVGSSPERFLRVDGEGRVESRPIKGTRRRGGDPVEDARERRALLASAKDRAENLMIVDLVRNDLGRVCELGSIERARADGGRGLRFRVSSGLDGSRAACGAAATRSTRCARRFRRAR